MSATELSKELAAMAVDGLLTAGVITKDDFDKAREIIEEEILARLCLRDWREN
jgi:hypothetical protein